jgi:hypothetical protein
MARPCGYSQASCQPFTVAGVVGNTCCVTRAAPALRSIFAGREGSRSSKCWGRSDTSSGGRIRSGIATLRGLTLRSDTALAQEDVMLSMPNVSLILAQTACGPTGARGVGEFLLVRQAGDATIGRC